MQSRYYQRDQRTYAYFHRRGGYSINGNGFVSTSGLVPFPNDAVTIRLLSSASFNTVTTATLTIGGVVVHSVSLQEITYRRPFQVHRLPTAQSEHPITSLLRQLMLPAFPFGNMSAPGISFRYKYRHSGAERQPPPATTAISSYSSQQRKWVCSASGVLDHGYPSATKHFRFSCYKCHFGNVLQLHPDSRLCLKFYRLRKHPHPVSTSTRPLAH